MNKLQIFRCRYTALAVLVLALGAAFSSLSFAQDKEPVISIADAKKLPSGSKATIEGTVTVASGSFISSFSDEGFQIQDKTSGMYITIKTDLHLKVGQKVRLTGKLTETALKFQIIETDEASVHVKSETARIKPTSIATGKLDDATIGRIIKITGKVTKSVDENAPYGFRFSLDDGSGEIIAYVATSTGVSEKDFVFGQKIELVGIAGKFNQRYQIYPRSPADVKLVGKTVTKQ